MLVIDFVDINVYRRFVKTIKLWPVAVGDLQVLWAALLLVVDAALRPANDLVFMCYIHIGNLYIILQIKTRGKES